MPRTSHASNSHPPISYPRVVDPSTASTSSITHQRKPSLTLTNPMGWLSRNSTQSSLSSSKTTKMASGSKSPKSIELVSERTGPLGLGATVVRTPEEALQDTNVCLTRYTETKPSADEMGRKAKVESVFQNPSPISTTIPLPLSSPPLPPTPDQRESNADVNTEDLDEYEEEEKSRPLVEELESLSLPARPSKECPSAPSSPTTTPRSSMEDLPSKAPPSLSNIIPYPTQPEFRAMLLSDVPAGSVDLSNVIITLETCTQTYRTTMDTLTSRPSQLSAYLISLFPPRKRTYSNASSVYSTSSEEDLSTYRHHLTSQGLISRSASNIHIFLDRPSAPYAHILNYLRSPIPSSGIPETLPRSIQLSQLDALLELRDEAAYLDLEGLLNLCNDEIKQKKQISLVPLLHTRNQSRTLQSSALNTDCCSVRSQQASVHAFPSPLDGQNNDKENRRLPNAFRLTPLSPNSLSRRCKQGGFEGNEVPRDVGSMRVRSPPTPQSWSEDTRSSRASSTTSRTGVFKNPPAGWI